jgi:DNA-binding beta-propeller fold protein YncE
MPCHVRSLAVLSLWMSLLQIQAIAQQPLHKHLMAVVSKGLPGITLYDADTDEPICNTKMGVSPHEAAFSLDGKTLYVPVYGSANVGQPGTDEHMLHLIDTSNCQIVASLDTGDYKRPHFPFVAPSGLLYLTAELKESILVIDPKARKIIGTIPTGSPTSHFFAMTKDEKKIFTSNVMAKSVSVLDVPERKVIKVIDTQTGNQRMTVSPDDKWFVTSLGQERKIPFYRTSDFELDFAVDVDGSPFVGRFSPDARYLYNMGNAPRGAQPPGIRVWKIDVATRKVVATSTEPLGNGTGGIAVNPVNGKVYLSAYSNQISVLDPETLKLTKQFPAEMTPDGLFFGPVK